MDPKIEKRFENVSKSKTFNNIVNIFSLDKKAVLDIGCSHGEFLINFGNESMGITNKDHQVEYGKEKNLNIVFGDIESESCPINKRFDVIFANNLLEHLYSPHNFLENIKKYLKQDGILILGVPCAPKLSTLLFLKKFRGSMAGTHINFFTRYTLKKTVERSGWRPITVRGFHFYNNKIDYLLNPIYPHFYVIATL